MSNFPYTPTHFVSQKTPFLRLPGLFAPSTTSALLFPDEPVKGEWGTQRRGSEWIPVSGPWQRMGMERVSWALAHMRLYSHGASWTGNVWLPEPLKAAAK
jgi:hypothetical protein